MEEIHKDNYYASEHDIGNAIPYIHARFYFYSVNSFKNKNLWIACYKLIHS